MKNKLLLTLEILVFIFGMFLIASCSCAISETTANSEAALEAVKTEAASVFQTKLFSFFGIIIGGLIIIFAPDKNLSIIINNQTIVISVKVLGLFISLLSSIILFFTKPKIQIGNIKKENNFTEIIGAIGSICSITGISFASYIQCLQHSNFVEISIYKLIFINIAFLLIFITLYKLLIELCLKRIRIPNKVIKIIFNICIWSIFVLIVFLIGKVLISKLF